MSLSSLKIMKKSPITEYSDKVIWKEHDKDFVTSTVKREHISNTRLMAL